MFDIDYQFFFIVRLEVTLLNSYSKYSFQINDQSLMYKIQNILFVNLSISGIRQKYSIANDICQHVIVILVQDKPHCNLVLGDIVSVWFYDTICVLIFQNKYIQLTHSTENRYCSELKNIRTQIVSQSQLEIMSHDTKLE